MAEAFAETPTGQGLLPTALAEADIAIAHARLARADSLSLVGMRRHAAHVVHALDPSVVSGAGPGLGFGVSRGAREASRHIELATATDTLMMPSDTLAEAQFSENVAVHLPHISASLAGAARRTDQAIALAQRIQTASSLSNALPLADQLIDLCVGIRYGVDANRDGIVGWQESEGGLAQATYHMNLLRRGEGLSP